MPKSRYQEYTPSSNDASTPWFSDANAGIALPPQSNTTTQLAQMTNQQIGQMAVGIQSQSGSIQTALTSIKTAILNLPSHA